MFFNVNSTALVTYEQRYTTLRLCPRKCSNFKRKKNDSVMEEELKFVEEL